MCWQPGLQSTYGFGWCNSVPKITVKQGTPDLVPDAGYPTGCEWSHSSGENKTWTETFESCASQFQVDTEHKLWYVTVLASGSGEMAFAMTATIMQQPSAAHYQNISNLMKQFHNEFNNESHYSGDLVKEIQVLQNEYMVTKAKLDICDAAFDKVNSGSSSGVALRIVDDSPCR